MKPTKKVFAVTGNESVVRTVLEGLIGFKAITVIMTVASFDVFAKVFDKNKSVVCRAEAVPTEVPSADVIQVYATDSNTRIYGVNNIINIKSNIIRQFMEIADLCDIDIGDHVSNASDKSPRKSDCLFCKLLAGKPVHYQASLYESENFLVIPGSGAFIDGYLMILPKPHVMSCAELPLNLRLEMLDVIDDVNYILERMYGKHVLIWENGSGMEGKGKPKTSIVHAHIHACPSELNVEGTTTATGIPINPININDLHEYKSDSYLLIRDYNNQWYISYDSELYIPRQYVRQLIALEHNIQGELWNWRRFPFWDNVEKTGNDFMDFIRHNYDKLSPRIRKATHNFI